MAKPNPGVPALDYTYDTRRHYLTISPNAKTLDIRSDTEGSPFAAGAGFEPATFCYEP